MLSCFILICSILVLICGIWVSHKENKELYKNKLNKYINN